MAKKKSIKVTAEVTPHHLSLTEEAVLDYDPNFKMNPPLRSKADLAAIKQALNPPPGKRSEIQKVF